MATNKIKGLTVEIGGDTTKLGKALEEVSTKGRDISSELGEINKLLKMDPKNTELLTQKQKVLADAIANTGKKLDTLKQAEKQVQEQFKRGEVSEEQVRALQREIVATEKKMEGYENAAKETADALKGVADSAEMAGEAGEGLGSKLGSAAKTGLTAIAGAATAAIGALVGCAEATREYRTEMGKLDTAFTTAGHTSEAATETYKSLQGVLGETEQAVEAANHLAQLCTTEEELAQWTDIATGVYATFGASLPIEGLTEAANETAKTGALTGGLADALNWAGVNEEAFQAKLDACSTEQERATLITETLNGLYAETAEQYKETNAELIRANEANEAWTASMADAGAAIEPILTDVKLLGASFLQDLMPGVTGVAEAFREILNGDEGAADALGEQVSGLLTSVLDKVVEIAPTVAQAALSLISTLTITLLNSLPKIVDTLATMATQAVTTIAALLPELLPAIVRAALGVVDHLLMALPELLSAVVLVVEAVIAALPEIIQLLVDRIPEILVELFWGVIPAVIDAAVTLFTAILEAIPVLIEQLAPLIPSIVFEIIDGLVECIPLLLEAAGQLLHAIVDAIPLLLEALTPVLPDIIDTIVSSLIEALPILLDAAVQLLLAIVQAIPKFLPALVQQLPTIITSITGTLLKNLPLLINAAIKLFFGILEAIPKIIAELTRQMPSIISAIVKGLSQGLTNMKQVGTDLVKGLWNGIKDMTGWIISKLQGFGDSVLDGIKNFFGIASPSKEMAWVGRMLDEGLVKGVEDYADKPISAMADLSQGMLDEAADINGVTLDRQLNHTFQAEPALSSAESGILGKLDSILKAIENGQILAIDGDTLVGATLSKVDAQLGQRRILATRGAL